MTAPHEGRDPDADRRAARRAAARRFHPDRGGDPAAFREAMAEADAVAEPPAPPQFDVRPTSRLGRARRRVRRTVRVVRGRLPRRLPGSTRYHEI